MDPLLIIVFVVLLLYCWLVCFCGMMAQIRFEAAVARLEPRRVLTE